MGVSIRPSSFVEGGAVPVDRNLLWEKCRFVLFNYTKRDGTVVATTTAAEIHYKDDDGQEFVQEYSVGDPERFLPSEDGKTLVEVGEAKALSKSSNFNILINSIVNAGFPENRIPEDGDVSVFDGLYAYHIGLPEPKRAGLARVVAEGEQARLRVVSVPSRILRLPWEKKAGKGAAKTAAKTTVVETEDDDDDNLTAEVLEFVGKHLDGEGATTRQKLAASVFRDLGKNPRKDAIASFIFKPEFAAVLLANGYAVTGENIAKTE